MDDVQRFAGAEFVAHRHHDAGGKERGKEIPLFQAGEIAVQFFAQAGRVVTFGKADGGGGFANEIVLLDQPPAVHVPPFGTVEHVIKSRLCGLAGFIGGTAQRFCGKTGLGKTLLRGANQSLPETSRHLIRRITPEAVEAEVEQVLHDPQTMPEQTVGIGGVFMIKLRQVRPHHLLRAVLTGSVGDAAVRFADEPFGMLLQQGGIVRAVIDHQINHEFQTAGVRAGNHGATLFIAGSAAGRGRGARG
jgi:hypothetical protein